MPQDLSPDPFPHPAPTETEPDLDPAFVFDFQAYDDPQGPGRRWTTWYDVEPLARGPEPRPDWVVTSQGAVDTDLGVLKTGKEADVVLLERADPHHPEDGVVMAAKRYRSPEHRSFHRAAAYTEGRSTRRSRDQRAIKRKSTFGRQVAAGEWAASEWTALQRLWTLGVPVPYPVQLDGTEILMEWISVEDEDGTRTAPRLAQTRPALDLAAHWFDQLREAMATMAGHGLVHGDLSAYNVLAAGERIVVIDVPQAVDLVGNLQGPDFLMRDCTNIGAWFTARGLAVDADELFAELMGVAF